MKTKLLVFFLIITLSTISQVWPTSGIDKLHGNIAEITETELIPIKKSKKPIECDTSSKFIYLFDNTNSLLKKTFVIWPTEQSPDQDSVITEYFYNDSGIVVNNRHCDLGNDFCNNHKYIVNEHGQISSIISFSENGDSISHKEFNYDQNNNEVERRTYSAYAIGGKLLYTSQFQYNENNELIEYKYFTANRKITSTNTFEYYQGLPIRGVVEPISGRKYTREYEYEFDIHGNWTKQTTKVKGRITHVVIRQIIYGEN